MFVLGNLIIGAATVINSLLFMLTIIIVASAVISWVNADPHNQIVRIIHALTTPLYRKIRRKVPTTFGGMDLTPIILLFIIMFIQSGIMPSVMQVGVRLAHGG